MTSLVDSLRPVRSLFAVRSRSTNPARINVTIRLWDVTGKVTVKDTPFSINPESPLKHILRVYAVREAVFPNCLGYLRFMVGSRQLTEDETPNDVRLSDGDCIDALPCIDDIIGSRFV